MSAQGKKNRPKADMSAPEFTPASVTTLLFRASYDEGRSAWPQAIDGKSGQKRPFAAKLIRLPRTHFYVK
jgi:hypothetical protein